jgi:hypothetical protein
MVTRMRSALTLLFTLVIASLCGVCDVRAQITFKSAASATAPTAAPAFQGATTATLALGASIQITYKASSSSSTPTVGATSLSVAMPAGTAANDIMIAVIMVTPALTVNAVSAVNGPAGWNLYEAQFVNETPGTRIAAFWKKAAAGE